MHWQVRKEGTQLHFEVRKRYAGPRTFKLPDNAEGKQIRNTMQLAQRVEHAASGVPEAVYDAIFAHAASTFQKAGTRTNIHLDLTNLKTAERRHIEKLIEAARRDVSQTVELRRR